MNYLRLFILLSPIALFLTGCENDDDNNGTLNQVENIINYNPAENYKGTYDITLQKNIALEFCKVEAINMPVSKETNMGITIVFRITIRF